MSDQREVASAVHNLLRKNNERWGEAKYFRTIPDTLGEIASALASIVDADEILYVTANVPNDEDHEPDLYVLAFTEDLMVTVTHNPADRAVVSVQPLGIMRSLTVDRVPNVLTNSTDPDNVNVNVTVNMDGLIYALPGTLDATSLNHRALEGFLPHLVRVLKDKALVRVSV